MEKGTDLVRDRLQQQLDYENRSLKALEGKSGLCEYCGDPEYVLGSRRCIEHVQEDFEYIQED